jgi:hypothetical protein
MDFDCSDLDKGVHNMSKFKVSFLLLSTVLLLLPAALMAQWNPPPICCPREPVSPDALGNAIGALPVAQAVTPSLSPNRQSNLVLFSNEQASQPKAPVSSAEFSVGSLQKTLFNLTAMHK